MAGLNPRSSVGIVRSSGTLGVIVQIGRKSRRRRRKWRTKPWWEILMMIQCCYEVEKGDKVKSRVLVF